MVATSGDPTTRCHTQVKSTNDFPSRKYPRAKFHDYNEGTFFVTVCTHNMIHYFGKILNDEMILSAVGRVLEYQLKNITNHYEDVEIPLFVVMPNHFHCIISIGDTQLELIRNKHKNFGQLNKLALETVATSGDPTLTTHHSCRLGNIISCLKAAVTRFARKNNMKFEWQKRYYDHIIRGHYDLDPIAEYIENNVERWADDCFYTDTQ